MYVVLSPLEGTVPLYRLSVSAKYRPLAALDSFFYEMTSRHDIIPSSLRAAWRLLTQSAELVCGFPPGDLEGHGLLFGCH